MIKMILTFVAVVASVAILAAQCDFDEAGKTEDMKLGAIQSRAERFVKETLKAPTTANFGGMFEVPEIIRHKDDPTIFWVFGKVTAQNSFGAMITSEYGVKMRQLCDDIWSSKCWTALRVQIGE